jgi:hypothetical protein
MHLKKCVILMAEDCYAKSNFLLGTNIQNDSYADSLSR